MHRSDVRGAALLNKAKAREGLTQGTGPAAVVAVTPPHRPQCVPQLTSTGQPKIELPAILEVPSIGMQAPVLNGLTDSVLNDSVGHDAATVWPGAYGVSILEAHDVSYFSNLGALKVGALISFIDNCREFVFQVDKTEVVTPGTALDPPSGGKGLALITCYPANALFWTSERLVVMASYVAQQSSGTLAASVPAPLALSLPLPPGLANADLSLSGNRLLVGTLSINGSPSKTWSQGADPLRAAQVAFRGLAAATRAVDSGNTAWWSSLALRGVAMPASIETSAQFNAIITVDRNTIKAIELQAPATTVDFTATGGKLYIASVTSSTPS